jgi:hypothetical protein
MGKRNKNDRDDWLKQDTGWPARQTIAHVMRLDKIMIWISIHLHALQRGERARERESERAREPTADVTHHPFIRPCVPFFSFSFYR